MCEPGNKAIFNETSFLVRLYFDDAHSNLGQLFESLKPDLPLNLPDVFLAKDADPQIMYVYGCQKNGLSEWGETETELFQNVATQLKKYQDIGFVGASVIYQAVYDNLQSDSGDLAIDELKRAGIARQGAHVSQKIPGGDLFLLGCPPMNTLGEPYFQPIVRYLALCQSDSEATLNSYLANAAFFSRDVALIKAHQNVHNFRVRSSPSQDNLQNILDKIAREIQELFNKTDLLNDSAKAALNSLSGSLSCLLKFYIEVNSTATSMVGQKSNYQHSFDAEPVEVAEGQVWCFLRERMNTLNEELQIKISECQAVLEAAQQAVSMVQTRIDQADEALEREQEQRLRRRDELLAYMGVAIALPELINYDVVEKILTSWKIYLIPIGYFFVQCGLIVVIGGLIVLFIKKSSFRKPRIIDEAKSEQGCNESNRRI